MFSLVFAGDDGKVYDHPSLLATGRTGDRFVELTDEDMVRLPGGASLVLVPGGEPVGLTRTGRFTVPGGNPWAAGRAWAVGALLPQGYTRTLLPAYRRGKEEKALPLLGYAAVACRDGVFYTAARPTEDPCRWDPAHYNTGDLPALVRKKRAKYPQNRILRQLARCSLEYQCFTAQNIFYGRWEGGIPVSPSCNARCLGCISLQPAECCPSPQVRINFKPSLREIVEVALPHLLQGEGSMVSFGQGCEGEPALASVTIVKAIGAIRNKTHLGTINMNSNGGHSAGVADICRAGLDSIRISLISAREDTYRAYYRPAGYSLEDVRRSLRTASSCGVYTALNLLVLPGLTDRKEEIEALLILLRDTGVNQVQLRNLNIDPDLLFRHLPGGGEIMGIPALLENLEEVPGLAVGSFSHPVR
jgi:pyruvate-formate lyase-activating enzyme